ncbi:hypothetical protein [Paludisphaera rhizosphaerae]|uniref:hypothetical protein n=1 Tax=Paludisphaera rhizosphaerae TaxID=2711216 RepID=UPI0013EDAC11|nr:hypothetical protein [Paludisphaera rhizosphaerae]
MPRKKRHHPDFPATVTTAGDAAATAMEGLSDAQAAVMLDEHRADAAAPQPEPTVQEPGPSSPKWADRFKPIASYPQEGVRVLEAKDHSAAGIAFADDQPPSRDEKDAMQAEGVRYAERVKAWTAPGTPEGRTAVQRLAGEIAGERRDSKARGGW